MEAVASFEPTVLVDLPEVIPPLTHLRGAALVASYRVLCESGLGDRIVRGLPPDYAVKFGALTASSWIPIDDAMAYYRVVDTLKLPHDEALRIGKLSADRTQSAFTATILRGLRGVVTPATVLGRMDRFWSRSARGGAPRVVQVGRREARVEAHGAPFLDLRYNRIALMGYYEQALSPTSKKITIREIARPGPKAAAWLVSWE